MVAARRRLTVQTFMVTDGFLFKQYYYHDEENKFKKATDKRKT